MFKFTLINYTVSIKIIWNSNILLKIKGNNKVSKTLHFTTINSSSEYSYFKCDEIKLSTTLAIKEGLKLVPWMTDSSYIIQNYRSQTDDELPLHYPSDSRGLQRKLTHMCDREKAINEDFMMKNQRYVRRINFHKHAVNLVTGTFYNNRPKAGFEGATQSFIKLFNLTLISNNSSRII